MTATEIEDVRRKLNIRRKLAGHQIILLAALDLERVDHEWTPQQLAVAAWKLSKEMFGLGEAWDLYPDSKRVECVLYARKGPLRGGQFQDRTLIRNVRKGVFSLTELGRVEAQKLARTGE